MPTGPDSAVSPRLEPATLTALATAVARPQYLRAGLRPGIVHVGLGAFSRAHLAVANEAALHANGDLRWGITGVSLRSPAVRDAMLPQSNLYTVATRDAGVDGTPRVALGVIGCITRVLVAPEEPQAVLEALAHPELRIISLTVTEKGYALNAASGEPHWDDPAIAHDLQMPSRLLKGDPALQFVPRSTLGWLVLGLALRHARGLGPVTLMSLDNLPHNGDTLAAGVHAFAQRLSPDLAAWVARECSFPNSMVDRIVPRGTAASRARTDAELGVHDAASVETEPFFDWALEDHFVAGRPDWAMGGARWVPQAQPWETLKLRMVNASHSAIAYLAVSAGWATVDEALRQPPLRRFIAQLLRDGLEPSLPALPDLDLAAYRERLLQRFANPALAHATLQIAMDGSQKVPLRLLPAVRSALQAGGPPERLAPLVLALAAWLHHLRGSDDAGRPYTLDDPQAAGLNALHSAAEREVDAFKRAEVLLSYAPVFGDACSAVATTSDQALQLLHALVPALQSLRQHGARATLDQWPNATARNSAGPIQAARQDHTTQQARP